MTWILIMTLHSQVWSFSNYLSVEFNTEQSCRYAGAQQEMVLRNDLDVNTKNNYTFICVPKG